MRAGILTCNNASASLESWYGVTQMMAYLRLTLMVAMLVTGGAATADENLLKVRFATDWKAQAEQVGFYQAKAL